MIEKSEIIETDPVYVVVTVTGGKTWGQIVPEEHSASLDTIAEFIEQRFNDMNASKPMKENLTNKIGQPIPKRPDKESKWDEQLKDWKTSGVMQ